MIPQVEILDGQKVTDEERIIAAKWVKNDQNIKEYEKKCLLLKESTRNFGNEDDDVITQKMNKTKPKQSEESPEIQNSRSISKHQRNEFGWTFLCSLEEKTLFSHSQLYSKLKNHITIKNYPRFKQSDHAVQWTFLNLKINVGAFCPIAEFSIIRHPDSIEIYHKSVKSPIFRKNFEIHLVSDCNQVSFQHGTLTISLAVLDPLKAANSVVL